MPRGGARPGAGRPKGSKGKKGNQNDTVLTEKEAEEAQSLQLTPLEYMLKVINDDSADKDRRDRMAIAAAQYVHGKPNEKGNKKTERAQRADDAGKGRFAPSAPPKLTTIKGAKP